MPRILIVEDDPLVRSSLRIIIEADGHAIDEAEDGTAALAFDLAGYDLVITDILMPGINGIEVIRAVRTANQTTPIIAISGGNRLGGEDPLDQARAAGADIALRKPFTARDLMTALASCMAAA